MEESLKIKTVSSLFWGFLQKASGQIISFIVSVILARILMPDDYGVVALAGMLLTLLAIFIDGGYGQVLIQKKEISEKEINIIFVTQLFISFLLYIILFFLSPFLYLLFDVGNEDLLVSLIRVMGLSMPLGALSGVQNAILTRRMMFRWGFYVNSIGVIISAVIGIWMAYSGLGAWALVGQSMSATILSIILISFFLDWKPRFAFEYSKFIYLFKEGSKYMGTSLLGTFFAQLNGYFLGIKYTPSDLAYFNRGGGIPYLLIGNIDGTIQTVLFPAMSQIQDDKDAIKRAISRSIRISTFVLMPMLFGLAAISDKLVIILYTEKWAPCIPYMQILCFCLAIGILCNVNLQALKATGHIGLVLKLEFIKKPIMLAVIIVSMLISPLAIVYGMLIFNIFVFFVNAYPNKKYINYSYWNQLIDVGPNIILSLIMAIIVYCLGRLNINMYMSVCIQVFSGASFYLTVSYLTKNESLIYVYDFIKNKIKERKQ